MTQPFFFSIATSGVAGLAGWRDLVKSTEDLGYDGLLLNDHVGQRLEAVTALATAAALSTQLRLGLRVANLSVRNPVLLAHAALSLDSLSGGRFELGIGAGWLTGDVAATGSSASLPAERFRRMTEIVHVLSELLRGRPITYSGEFLSTVVGEPLGQPVNGRVPLAIGAAGPHMLALAARCADVVSIMGRSSWEGGVDQTDLTPERLDDKVRLIAEAEVDRATPARRNHVLWECLVTPRPGPVITAYAAAAGMTPSQLCASPGLLVGSPSQVIDELLRRRDRWGITDVTVPAEAARAFAPVVEGLR